MPETIFDLISENARNTPEAPALLAPGRTDASYARLQRPRIDMVERPNAIGGGAGDGGAVVRPRGPEGAVRVRGGVAGAARSIFCIVVMPVKAAESVTTSVAATTVKVVENDTDCASSQTFAAAINAVWSISDA